MDDVIDDVIDDVMECEDCGHELVLLYDDWVCPVCDVEVEQ